MKIKNIYSTIKVYGQDSGTRNIFICFGNSEAALIGNGGGYVPNPLDITQVASAVEALNKENYQKSIWFCGAEPLKRGDWIKRLTAKTPGIPFNILTKIPDPKALAVLLPFIEKIELSLSPTDNSPLQEDLQKFILLSKCKDFLLHLDVSGITPEQAGRFICAITKNITDFPILLTSRKHDLASLIPYYDRVVNCTPQVYIQANKPQEVANEDTYKQ